MSLTKVQSSGSLQGFDSGVLVESHDMAFTTNVGESVSGSFLLTAAAGGAKNITLSELSRPYVVSIRSNATVLCKFRTAAGSDSADDYAIRVDGFSVAQVDRSMAVVEINVSHIGATSAQQLHYFVASSAIV